MWWENEGDFFGVGRGDSWGLVAKNFVLKLYVIPPVHDMCRMYAGYNNVYHVI